MHAVRLAIITLSVGYWISAPADEKRPIEEILVTAQRIEEPASRVPIAISVYSDTMIRDRQIIGISDLQTNVPNLGYIPQPAGGAQVTLRGIGVLLSADDRAAAGPSAPLHLNGLIAPLDISVIEFFDLERVEVLRGPQGTLYGRNATAGAINLITRKPSFDGLGGYVDLEYGDYDHTRVQGAFNFTPSERLAVRLAGMSLDRDGYIENKAARQIPGLKSHIDDRDLHAYRLTAEWRPADGIDLWAMYGRFKESDSKVRNTNVICRQSALPYLGCDPDAFGRDLVNPASILGTIIASGTGAVDPGNIGTYEFPRPPLGLREQHTDFDPVFSFRENVWMFGAGWQLDPITLSLTAGYFENQSVRQQDFSNDVGDLLNATPQNPSGLWPTSAPSGPVGALRGGGPCDLESGRAGLAGGCTPSPDLNRSFAYEGVSGKSKSWAAEIQARSDSGGRFDFLLGLNYLHQTGEGEFGTYANTVDSVGLVGFPGLGIPQLYPSFLHFGNRSRTTSFATFGELYNDLTSELKLTVGLRYNRDRSDNDLATTLFSSTNVAPFFGGSLGAGPIWIRNEMLDFFPDSANPPTDYALALADYYGATQSIQSATDPGELIAALQLVPPAPRFGEGQDLSGLPRQGTWHNVSGRIGLDWSVSEDALLYLFFTQGYRPGGVNVAPGLDPKYDDEQVNAIELGVKTRWVDNSLSLNAALFYNDHQDLQISRVSGIGSDVTENINARTMGFELETIWKPIQLPRLSIEFAYAWLNAEVRDDTAVDPLNRTQGNAGFVNLKNSDGVNDGYIAPLDQVLPLVEFAVNEGLAQPEWGVYENGIPVYFNRGFLGTAGVPTSAGLPADLDGKDLANSPPHSTHLGVAYTWTLAPGSLTLRYDYFWQSDSYGREFNTRGDEIDSWTQHNASATFESASGRWAGRAWIRNFTNEDNVRAQRVGADGAGNFRVYWLAEPRIFGASIRYNFGVP